MQPKILAFAGSTRADSFNKKLVACAARAAEQAGAAVTLIDLRDYPMPLYDGDLERESGLPDHARRLYELMKSHHGMLISCPEYNSAITAVLKNAIDWVSRPVSGDPGLAAFRDKTAGLLAATPGSLGGLRTLVSVRTILGNLGVFVVPRQFGLANASSAFGEDGELIAESAQDNVAGVSRQLVETTSRLACCPDSTDGCH